MFKLYGLSVFAVLLAGMTAPASAASFSYTGNFVNDSDVQLFNFNLLASTTVTLQTFSYGGGTNSAGNTIVSGGFEPTLQIFDFPSGAINGGSILPGDVASCGPRNTDPNRPIHLCREDFAQVFLAAGNYVVALTENPNVANGPNLSDGFFADTDPQNLTAINQNHFADVASQPGDGHWALDITVRDVGAATPEPGSALLAVPALFLVGLGIRKRVH
jgi:hypothetical protein